MQQNSKLEIDNYVLLFEVYDHYELRFGEYILIKTYLGKNKKFLYGP